MRGAERTGGDVTKRRGISGAAHRKSLGLALLMLSAICLVGCEPTNPQAEQFLDVELSDGRPVSRLLSKDQVTVLLLYAKSMCYSCSNMYSRWEERAREGRIKLVLLLDEPLTEADARAFRMQRIPVSGSFAAGRIPVNDVPSEYIVHRGRVVAQAVGALQRRERRLWLHPCGHARGTRAVPDMGAQRLVRRTGIR